jgi:hypothetical protein
MRDRLNRKQFLHDDGGMVLLDVRLEWLVQTEASELRRRSGMGSPLVRDWQLSRISPEESTMNCPYCLSTTTKQQSKKTTLGYRTLRCSACRRTFNERSGTPFNSLEYPTDIVLLVVFWRLR